MLVAVLAGTACMQFVPASVSDADALADLAISLQPGNILALHTASALVRHSIIKSPLARVVAFFYSLAPTAPSKVEAHATRKIKAVPINLQELSMSTCSVLDTPQVESQHVHEVYDAIATHWHHTRHTAWPRVTDFLQVRSLWPSLNLLIASPQALPSRSVVADIGCGNGKYMSDLHFMVFFFAHL